MTIQPIENSYIVAFVKRRDKFQEIALEYLMEMNAYTQLDKAEAFAKELALSNPDDEILVLKIVHIVKYVLPKVPPVEVYTPQDSE